MKTMVEYDTTRILWDLTPTQVRDRQYPGADMSPLNVPLPKSVHSFVVFCQRWQLSRLGQSINICLTEVP